MYSEQASLTLMSERDSDEELIVARLGMEAEDYFLISNERVEKASAEDEVLQTVLKYVLNGFPSSKHDMAHGTEMYWRYRDGLSAYNPLLLFEDRIVIPTCLRKKVIETVHSAHQCITGMTARAQVTFFWPGMSNDIENARINCRQCNRNAPSQAKLPPNNSPPIPQLPFELLFGDYFKLCSYNYLVAGDRLSGWTEVIQVTPGTKSSGAEGLCTALRILFATFGVPYEISHDGGPEFIGDVFKEFMRRWGVKHQLASSYHPQSNGRAEVAVKTTRRLLENNVAPDGSLDTDNVVRALLQLRNTPDRDAKVSPAQILFGRPLRDCIPHISKEVSVFDNPQMDPKWHAIWRAKEEALRARHARSFDILAEHSQPLDPLTVGSKVFIQNQDKSSKSHKKWDRTGVVVVVNDNDQYLIRVDGTGRTTLRNRRFLKKFQGVVKPVLPTVPHCIPIADKKLSSPNIPLAQEVSIESESETTKPTVQPSVVNEQDDVQPVPCEKQSVANENVSVQPAVVTRRSGRVVQQREMYDASTGTYVPPNA